MTEAELLEAVTDRSIARYGRADSPTLFVFTLPGTLGVPEGS